MRSLRSLLLLAAFAALPTLVFAADGGPAPQVYGTMIRVTKPLSVGKLARDPAKFKGRTIRIEGTVHDVCQGAGCWVEVKDAKGAMFLAKSLDESVLLPKDCKGQRIVVEGVVTALPARSADPTEVTEADGHACPTPNYVLSTRGIELRPAPAK